MKINKPYIESKDGKVYLCANIEEDDKSKVLWYAVDSEYRDYVTAEKVDAFVVNLLFYAMIKKEDIFWEGEMSEKLYYQLLEYWIPTIAREISEYHLVSLVGKTNNNIVGNPIAVGTGVSGGG